MISVNGNNNFKAPSSMTWGKQDVSDSESGRDQTAYMYKNKVAEKIKIDLSWQTLTPEEAHAVISAFQDEYFNVTYYDFLQGGTTTKTFYCGDMSAPVKLWVGASSDGKEKRYADVSFNIIER